MSLDNTEGPVQVVFRIGKILDIIASQAPVTLKQLTIFVQLPKTTVYRLTRALEQEHIVAKTSKGYVLGPRLNRWQPPEDLFSRLQVIADPLLSSIARRTGETASVFIRTNDARQCIAVAPSPQVVRHVLSVGDVFPLGVGAGGKLLISHLMPSERSRILTRTCARFPDVTIPYGTLDEELDEIKLQGYAVSLEEREAGLASVSYLLATLPSTCLTVSGPSIRFDPVHLDHILVILRDAAERLNADLREIPFQELGLTPYVQWNGS
ncbi:MAG: hypothetical protein C7B46_00550 [Sulfobacillus benefaciens]|uniref:IclR family transcriptional regulator n=1 Tax=Sulfobacillus benefaciens TaxID=453960 RepID=A0A2T2XLZ6_9FIRM|nr:MAG: hypothetical protein C7B46_00550 [Sulfobacillus benefaciens]